MARDSIYSLRSVKRPKPQQEWRTIIAIYLYLAGMGAGAYIIGMLVNWFVHPSRVVSIQGLPFDSAMAALLWGPILVAISAPFLILDLGLKRRFLYACLNPRTSWVARGFLILSIFILFGLFVLGKSVLPFRWLHPESTFWLFVEAITVAFAFATALYTGVLLKATRAVPLWNTNLLPALFVISALSTGSMAIILSTFGTGVLSLNSGTLKTLMRSEQVLVVVEATVLYLFLFKAYKTTEQGRDSVRLLLWGEMKPIFWGGIVLLGLVFPMILEGLAFLFPGNAFLIVVAGLLLLSGGFFLRIGILSAGIKERIPMIRLMEMQYQLVKNLKSESRNRCQQERTSCLES